MSLNSLWDAQYLMETEYESYRQTVEFKVFFKITETRALNEGCI